MKKKFVLDGLGCASCAAKMETAIQKLPGVNSATISFLTQKLILEAEEEHIDEIFTKAASICKRIEPDCQLKR